MYFSTHDVLDVYLLHVLLLKYISVIVIEISMRCCVYTCVVGLVWWEEEEGRLGGKRISQPALLERQNSH